MVWAEQLPEGWKRYVVNTTFDGGVTGEYIALDPAWAQDWIKAQFISEVDAAGVRIVRGDTVGGGPGIVPEPITLDPVEPRPLEVE